MANSTTTAKRKPKTAAQLKADLAKAKKRVAELEQRAYAEELVDLAKQNGAKGLFETLRKAVEGASDIAILKAIGAAAEIKRLTITQAPVTKRKPKEPKSS